MRTGAYDYAVCCVKRLKALSKPVDPQVHPLKPTVTYTLSSHLPNATNSSVVKRVDGEADVCASVAMMGLNSESDGLTGSGNDIEERVLEVGGDGYNDGTLENGGGDEC